MINDLVSYFSTLAKKHIKIKGFYSGDLYEINGSEKEFPFLFVNTNVNSTYFFENTEISTRYLYFEFSLLILDKSLENQDENLTFNFINSPNLNTLQNTTLSNTYAYLHHIIGQFIDDCNDDILPYIIKSITNIIPRKRVYVDDADGWECFIRIQIPNIWYCEKEMFLTEDSNYNKQ